MAKITQSHTSYVWFGTNQFNFETLPNPPTFRPKFCDTCHKPVKQNTESYSPNHSGGVTCGPCLDGITSLGLQPDGAFRHIFKTGGGP